MGGLRCIETIGSLWVAFGALSLAIGSNMGGLRVRVPISLAFWGSKGAPKRAYTGILKQSIRGFAGNSHVSIKR